MTDERPGGYPWFRVRLSPTTLRDCLLVGLPSELAATVPDAPRMLADLDARAWEWFTRDQCEQLADLIVNRVREQTSMLVQPGPLADRRLPPMPRNGDLADLQLSVRSYNALRRSPLGHRLEHLGSVTLDDVLGVRGMGAKGLVELLIALEEAGAYPQPDADARTSGPADVDEEPPDPDAFAGGLTEQEASHLGAWCRGELEQLPATIMRRRLPAIPERTHVSDLALLPRTAGAIERAGHAELGQWLRDATIRDILLLPNFGRTSMRDLLDGIVRLMLQPPPSAELTALARGVAELELADLLHGDDPRLVDSTSAWCRRGETIRESVERLARRARDPADLLSVVAQLRATQHTLQRLDTQTLEDELTELAVSVSDERAGAMFARYNGWDGRGGVSLSVVGDEFGVTRERVRQVCRKPETRLQTLRPYGPILCRALAKIAFAAPLWADEAEELLREQQMTLGSFEPQALIDAGTLLGLNVPIQVQTVAGRDRVSLVDDDSAAKLETLIRLVRRLGRRTVEHWGVGRIQDVTATAIKESSQEIDETFVRDLLTEEDGFRWLSEERGWFWNADVPRNRLTNQIDKVLCVAQKLAATDLRVAVVRHYRMEGQIPPLDIFSEFCRQLPNRLVEDGVVRAEPPLAPADILAETELLFYQTLSANGSVMSRIDLEAVCREHGMNRVTFYLYLGNSPILTCPRRGIYALVGSAPNAAPTDTVIVRRKLGRVFVTAGHLDDGRVWLIYRVSKSMLTSGAFATPVAMRSLIGGDYGLRTSSGVVGKISCREYSAWGLFPFLRHEGARVGDYFSLVFDGESHEVLATLGDETLLQQFVADGADLHDELDADDELDGDEQPHAVALD